MRAKYTQKVVLDFVKCFTKEKLLNNIPIEHLPNEDDANEFSKRYLFTDELNIPRTEFLLHDVKAIERQLLWWYQDNKYSQGDSYSVSITGKGKWMVSHSNDYPMQHGAGKSHILTEEEYQEAMKITKIIK